MKVARYTVNGKESYGVMREDNSIVDVPKLGKTLRKKVPKTIDALISLGDQAENLIVEMLSDAPRSRRFVLDFSQVVLRAPVASPPKVICLGLNYRDHAKEAGASLPDEPIIFMKPRTAIVGPEEPVKKPSFVEKLDYEVELGVVIGKVGRNIPVSKVKEHIFGYTVFNDISARDIQFKDGQWTRGKSFDTFAPLGPCIVTASQIDDPNNLRMWTRINGETRQNSSTKHMLFNVYEIVHHLSKVMTLEPCDVIATGTPAGVAAFMKPKPKFLQPGDIVEVEIEKIGKLRNPIVTDN
ncbi:MAG: fumarylacetoacetate hydrolase family protein [Candidatus Bathyarchaeia archaeon]|nr:fumarylacetoacetate hydrolase family protein [Candidatus Bathyarchaeota archaeon]